MKYLIIFTAPRMKTKLLYVASDKKAFSLSTRCQFGKSSGILTTTPMSSCFKMFKVSPIFPLRENEISTNVWCWALWVTNSEPLSILFPAQLPYFKTWSGISQSKTSSKAKIVWPSTSKSVRSQVFSWCPTSRTCLTWAEWRQTLFR